jgi:hypothetical protein
MAKQFRIKRTVQTVAVQTGNFVTFDLPRGYDYESAQVRLYGTVNVTTAFTSVRAEAPCQLVQRLDVIVDGRNTSYSAPMWYATLANYDRQSKLETGARATTPPTAAAIASYVFEAIGNIDFATMDGERSKDSNLRTDGMQLFQCRVTFGQAADMFVGAGVATLTNAFVEITTTETVELTGDDGARTTPTMFKKVSFQELALTTSNANQEIRIPAGNLIKSVVLRTDGSTTAGEPSTAVLNRLQLVSGVDVRVNTLGAALRAQNNSDFGQLQQGYYVADLTRCGSPTAKLSELWDVTRQAEPKLVLDVTGGANVKAQSVTTEYLYLGA